MEKELQLLHGRLKKIEERNFDLNSWKKGTVAVIDSILGPDNLKRRLIEEIEFQNNSCSSPPSSSPCCSSSSSASRPLVVHFSSSRLSSRPFPSLLTPHQISLLLLPPSPLASLIPASPPPPTPSPPRPLRPPHPSPPLVASSNKSREAPSTRLFIYLSY